MIAAWEDIINTSIIGTEKKQVVKNILPAEIIRLAEEIEQGGADKEEQFLKLAAIVYSYRRGGFRVSEEKIQVIPECEPESLAYCSPAASASLQGAIGEEIDALLMFWLDLCRKNKKVVQPEFVVTLLEKAEKNKELKPLIIDSTGKRGAWLSLFNPSWNFASDENMEEIFKTGLIEERKQALTRWRKADPATARESLISVWKEEQAAVKTELLSIMEINLSAADLEFLALAWKEKSQKVKEVALDLLKMLPDSFVVQETWNFLKTLISVKKSGALFGLVNKEQLEINLKFEVPETLKSYGISHLDAEKNFSEKEFSFNQMLSLVPTSFLERHLQMRSGDLLDLFSKNENSSKYIPALAVSSSTFNNIEWGILLFKQKEIVCEKLVKEFDSALREKAALKALNDNQKNIYAILPDRMTEWSLDFAMALLKKTSLEPFTYTRQYYKQLVHHFPLALAEKLDSIEVNDEFKNTYWKNIAEEIKQMLAIKKQIIESF